MRQTSIEAYRKIKANGLLSTRRFQVYEALVLASEPLTQNETWKRIKDSGVNLMPNSVTPRFKELERLGVIKIAGERTCRVTGHNDNTYTDTGGLPDESGLPKKREAWHVVFRSQNDPEIKRTRIEFSEESANEYAQTLGDRLVEIIHFREVLD